MRELPSFHLSQVSVMGKDVPSNYNLVANDTPIEGRVLGNVYKDPGALQARMIWAAWVRIGAGEMVELGHFGTRQKAALEVAKKWVLFMDEIEAHAVAETIDNTTIKAIEDAKQQREYWGDDSHLAIEYGDKKVVLDDEYSDARLTYQLAEGQQHIADLLSGRKQLAGDLWLRSIDRLTYGSHIIDLELERRARQAKIQQDAQARTVGIPEFCAECHLHVSVHPNFLDPNSENENEDCCGHYQHQLRLTPALPPGYSSWGSWCATYFKAIEEEQNSLLQPTDGALVRSIHEHLVSPWRPVPSVRRELLDAVRELEIRALDNEKRRPASMVVELGDAIDKRVAKLERQHKMLKDRTTMLLAGVVTLLGDDEETLLGLLRTTFAVTDEDPTDELETPEKPVESSEKDLDDGEWRQNPYSLPPNVKEGVECPACRDAGKVALGLTTVIPTVRHKDTATVNECIRRQRLMGWKGEAKNQAELDFEDYSYDDGPYGEV